MRVIPEVALQWLQPAVAYLRETFEPKVIYLFGSMAEGRMRPDSDVDLALLPDAPLPRPALYEAAQELACRLNRDVDLVDLLNTTTVLQSRVAALGMPLYERSRNERVWFEMYALKAYALLNEEREVIRRAMAERGSAF
ncbi:MAG: nucleotidyltransferase domain-containing protein [Thermoflavifilum sp.]|nr:nucleotidyltransferase domain-containing protein [Thermoflavifilum sp.]MCL6514940.1 nucleotidyltransferase domain-containing protein [Alicyclobacillus sp.]